MPGYPLVEYQTNLKGLLIDFTRGGPRNRLQLRNTVKSKLSFNFLVDSYGLYGQIYGVRAWSNHTVFGTGGPMVLITDGK